MLHLNDVNRFFFIRGQKLKALLKTSVTAVWLQVQLGLKFESFCVQAFIHHRRKSSTCVTDNINDGTVEPSPVSHLRVSCCEMVTQ